MQIVLHVTKVESLFAVAEFFPQGRNHNRRDQEARTGNFRRMAAYRAAGACLVRIAQIGPHGPGTLS